MAYGEKYYVEHIADVDGNTRTYRIEILQDGYEGGVTDLQGWGAAGVATLSFDRLGRDQIFEGVVQKGRLQLHIAVQNSTELAVLTDIFNGDEDEYQLRLKEDGGVKWTGFCIPDMIQYSEGDYPFNGTVTAKDASLLESLDFETNTAINYELYSTLFGTLLNGAGLDLDIHTYNDWTALDISDTDDYFHQIYVDKYHLQNFTSFSEGQFESISYLEALNKILPPGFIVRQYDGVWNIFDLSYLAKSGGTVDRYEYDSTGTKTGSTTSIDLTEDVDRVDNYILPSSVRDPWRPLKQLRLEFNHKTSIQNLLFDSIYTVNSQTIGEFKSESMKVSDTSNRQFSISGDVTVTTDTDPGSFRSGTAQIIIQVDDYELDISSESFDLNAGEQDVNVSGNDTTLTGAINVDDVPIPVQVNESTLKVEFRFGSVSGETVQKVEWENFSASINNADDVATGASKFYRLTQSGNYSPKAELPPIIIGQGPDDQSNSALRYFSSGGVFELATSFRHIGETGVQYEEFVLTNILGLQRNAREALNADLRALYNPRNLLTYQSDNYLFLDGKLSVREAQWNATLVELQFEAGSDTFSEFTKITDQDSGATIATSSGTGSTDDLDDRYLQESSNLSDLDNIATARDNLGLTDQTADLDLDSLSINGTNLFPDNDPQALGTGDAVDFATVNTGQGDNELYAMDQDVRTSDTVSFLTGEFSGGPVNTIIAGHQPFAGDANNITTSGFFALTTSDANHPSSGGIVGWSSTYASDRVAQIAHEIGGESVFTRKLLNSTWSDWKQIYIEGEDVSYGAGTFTGLLSAQSSIDVTSGNIDIQSGQIQTSVGNLTDIYHMDQNVRTTDNVTFVKGTFDEVDSREFAIRDTRDDNPAPDFFDKEFRIEFKKRSTVGVPGSGNFGGIFTIAPWKSGDDTGNAHHQLFFNEGGLFWRQGQPSSTSSADWGTWRDIAYDTMTNKFTFSGELEVQDTLTGVDAVFSSTLDVGGVATFGDDHEADNFALTTDFSGTGWEGTYGGDFNIRNLVVREAARFRHLIIDELGIIAGSDLRSIARGKIKEVNAGNNQVILENPRDIAGTSWVANDFFWVKAVDVDGGIFLDLKGQVTNVDTTNSVITLTLDTTVTGGTHDGGTTDISNLSVGNVLVQRGHPSNSDRQSLIYTTVSDSDAPVQKWFTGVDSLPAFDDQANIQFATGNVSAITDSNIDFGLFGRDFDIQAGNDYWRTSDNTGRLGDGVFTWDGNATQATIAGWTATTNKIAKGNLQIISDNTGFTGLFDGTPAGVATVSAVNTPTDFEDRIYVHAGETYSSGWTGRFGLSVTQSKIQDALFEVSADMSTGALTAKIAGASFDADTMWSANNGNTFKGSGLYINWGAEDFSLGSDLYFDSSVSELGLTGTLLMGTGGEITNNDGDYSITEGGITFDYAQDGSIQLGTADKLITWEAGSDGFILGAQAVNDFSVNAYDAFFLQDTTNDVRVLEYIHGTVDNVQDVEKLSINANLEINGVNSNRGKVTIADDDFGTIGRNIKGGTVEIGFTGSNNLVKYAFRDASAVELYINETVVGTFNYNGTIETPTGTTGTDGTVTIFVDSNQKMYIENRSGSSEEFFFNILETDV